MYPPGHSPDDTVQPPDPQRPGGPVPASTILIFEPDPTAADSLGPILSDVGYTVTRVKRLGPVVRRPSTEHQLAVVDLGASGGAEGRVRRRRVPRDPGDAGDGRRADPVRRRHRRCRGAHPVPGGRRGRRHRAPIRRTRGRGPHRGAAAPLPALEGARAGHLGRRADAGEAAPDGRRVQPQGRRRDDDDRHEHRGRGRPAQARSRSCSSTSTCSSAASRPT